ncbi:MAG: hypothetical protein EXS67_02235 [Candidatus Margulisbacteria bacterium]|nr:hypothetical protein [Candidatus Margulisiibacteriota bacterium]
MAIALHYTLENNHFVSDHTSAIILELDDQKKAGYVTEIPVDPLLPPKKVKIGKNIFNNLTLSNNRFFVSIYRSYDSLGLPLSGKEVLSFDFRGKKKQTIFIDGDSPNKIVAYRNKLFIEVVSIKGSMHSGIEVFDQKTLKKIGEIDFGEYFPITSWSISSNNDYLYAFGYNDHVVKHKSPYLTEKQKKDTSPYEIFFKINTHSLKTEQALLSPFSGVGNFVINKDRLIIPATHVTEGDGLFVYSLKLNKFLKKSSERHPGHLLKISYLRNELYGLDWFGNISIYDLSSFQFKQKINFKGTRDFVVIKNHLFLNRRSLLTNGYTEEPKVTVVNLDTSKVTREIKGVFGPFALIFDKEDNPQ